MSDILLNINAIINVFTSLIYVINNENILEPNIMEIINEVNMIPNGAFSSNYIIIGVHNNTKTYKLPSNDV